MVRNDSHRIKHIGCLYYSKMYIGRGDTLDDAKWTKLDEKHMTESGPAGRYRFGTFEADAGTGELRRRGMLVRLNGQPFQLLMLLLDRQGALLTREEISEALWPDGTVVDFEHGVNSAINRIRDALGDSAANPTYVQTLARRGYRFVAPVERVDTPVSGGRVGRIEEAVESLNKRTGGLSRFLATPEDLPKTPPRIVQTIFIALQGMYLAFYIGALANLREIQTLLLPLERATQIFMLLVFSAAIMIPVRTFLICAVLFRAPALRAKFLKLWPFLLLLDVIWSSSPFLLLHHINFGLALACTTLLVYSPFAQRSLMLMGAGGDVPEFPQ